MLKTIQLCLIAALLFGDCTSQGVPKANYDYTVLNKLGVIAGKEYFVSYGIMV